MLQGIETIASEDQGLYAGEVIELAPVRVQPGPGTVNLSIRLPQGYKVNELAPTSFELDFDTRHIQVEGETSYTQPGMEFPQRIPVQFKEGESTLGLNLALYYCEDGRESLCYYLPLRFQVPFIVEKNGSTEVTVEHSLPEPRLP